VDEVHLRDAEPRDAPVIADLCRQLGYPVPSAAVADHLRELSGRSAEHRLLVAMVGGAVVGWLEVSARQTLDAGRFAEISGLVVDERRRGAGVGKRLIDAARSWAGERGVPRLRVRTNVVRERTARFYEREGFRLAKQQRVYDLML
jgi:GNAT superfamily N-acetyltransferase